MVVVKKSKVLAYEVAGGVGTRNGIRVESRTRIAAQREPGDGQGRLERVMQK